MPNIVSFFSPDPTDARAMVSFAGNVTDSFELQTPDGLLLAIEPNVQGNELIFNHVGSFVEAAGTLIESEGFQTFRIESYRLIEAYGNDKMAVKRTDQGLYPSIEPGRVNAAAITTMAPSSGVTRVLRELSIDLALISAGCIIFILGLNSILVQHRLIAGGLTGAAILLNHLKPGVEIGWWYLLLNLPLAWLGWHNIGRRFMLLTIFGMVFFSLAAVWVKPPPLAIQDPLLALLAAGVVCGLGAGLVLRSSGSAGGLDILAVFFNNRFGFSIGAVGFALNALILVAGGFLYSLEAALYSALFLFVCSRVVDAVIAGVNPYKVMLVISDHAEAVGAALLRQNNCRITFLKGEGGYSRGDKKIIYSVAPMMAIPRLKAGILQVDPEAFVVVYAACEVTQHKTFAGMTPCGGTTAICQEKL
jgi:uncharacterized membrane-anchored protein YitT (DUF2179 family)